MANVFAARVKQPGWCSNAKEEVTIDEVEALAGVCADISDDTIGRVSFTAKIGDKKHEARFGHWWQTQEGPFSKREGKSQHVSAVGP